MTKTILISGASSGIAEETARALLAAGYIKPGAIISQWNGIAHQQLMKHSGSGTYADSAHAYVKFMESVDQGRLPSTASVAAKTIVKAVASCRPKTRYITGGCPVPASGAAGSRLPHDDATGRTSAEEFFGVSGPRRKSSAGNEIVHDDSTGRNCWRMGRPDRELKTLGVYQ